MEQFLLLGANPVTGWLNNMLHRFLLWIDSAIYKLVSMSYQLFVYLSSVEIFTQDFFKNFALRIYAILGVFMLFYLAYALLNAIIDPDKGITGEKGVGKIAFNLVKALVLLGLLPTIFSYAMRLQNFILSENIIGTIILGTSKEDTNNILVTFGDNMSYKVLNAFINPEEYDFTLDSGVTWSYAVDNYLLGSGSQTFTGGNYSWLPDLAPAVISPQQVAGVGSVTATYLGVISSIAGGFLIYIILSFCLDLGVRVVKLAYCQLIAPIPIVLSIIPSKKSVMDKWVKLTISTYFEVFVRVGIMYLVAYFMSKFFSNNTILDSWGNGMVGKFGMVVIILGLFAFAKQLPKLISDTLGIDSGNIKLGIRDKLKTSVEGMDATIGRIPGTKRLAGGVTGALGAGWTAAWNGRGAGNILRSMRMGAFNGLDQGGFQFSKQRQETYKTMGYKGKAGLFGQRAFFDYWQEKYKDKYSDYYKDKVLSTKLNDYENLKKNQSWANEFNANLKKALENAGLGNITPEQWAAAKEELERLDEARPELIKNVMNNLRKKLKTTEDVNQRKELENLMEDLKNGEDLYDEAGNFKYSSFDENSALENNLKETAKQENIIGGPRTEKIKQWVYNPAKGKAEIVINRVTAEEATAYKNTRKHFRDKDINYDNMVTVVSARMNEASNKEWASGEEGQHWIYAHKQASKASDDKGAPPPPKPGGGGPK